MLIETRDDEAVLQIRLNRPEHLNALTLALARELLAAVRRGLGDPRIRVLMLSGEGRAFCAGKDRDAPPTPEFVAVLQELTLALMEGGKPVVAAVQGWAVGAGLEIMLNCDVVVAARTARFMLPEAGLGLFGTGAVASLLPRIVGLQRAKALMMLGREFGAADAERWGIVWSIVDDASLIDAAIALSRQLAAGEPSVLAALKTALHRESIGDLPAVLEREAKMHGRS
jgi:enoyl-CoA hydratase/carnithine racemase